MPDGAGGLRGARSGISTVAGRHGMRQRTRSASWSIGGGILLVTSCALPWAVDDAGRNLGVGRLGLDHAVVFGFGAAIALLGIAGLRGIQRAPVVGAALGLVDGALVLLDIADLANRNHDPSTT